MLRIEFTADDIARTRVVPGLGRFAETALGLGSLRLSRPAPVTPPWRSVARGPMARPAGELAELMVSCGVIQLDLFSLLGAADSFEEGLGSFLAVPDRLLRDEVRVMRCASRPMAPWLRGIENAELPARRRMGRVLDRLHRSSVAPYWTAIEAALAAEQSRLQRLLADGGVERLLSSLHPLAHWSAPVLELPMAGRWSATPLDAKLSGRGLVIAPSALCAMGPVPYFPQDGTSAVLLYPALAGTDVARLWVRPEGRGRNGHRNPLAALLGRTRAAALEAIGEGCTTTELAGRIGVSPPTASQHATALRDAGLVSSLRDRNRMLHSLTPLGLELLEVRRDQ